MAPLDWVILSNSAWQRVAIHKQQIAAILDDLNSDGRGQNAPQAASACDSAGTIIEDFAHHPTAIRETLRALRSVYPQSRLWAILEPRSNTLRRKVLEADLIASLRQADLAVVYDSTGVSDPSAVRTEANAVLSALLKAQPGLRMSFHGLWAYALKDGKPMPIIELAMAQIP